MLLIGPIIWPAREPFLEKSSAPSAGKLHSRAELPLRGLKQLGVDKLGWFSIQLSSLFGLELGDKPKPEAGVNRCVGIENDRVGGGPKASDSGTNCGES